MQNKRKLTKSLLPRNRNSCACVFVVISCTCETSQYIHLAELCNLLCTSCIIIITWFQHEKKKKNAVIILAPPIDTHLRRWAGSLGGSITHAHHAFRSPDAVACDMHRSINKKKNAKWCRGWHAKKVCKQGRDFTCALVSLPGQWPWAATGKSCEQLFFWPG